MKKRSLTFIVLILLFVTNLNIISVAAQTADNGTIKTGTSNEASMPHYAQALKLRTMGLFSGTEKGFELNRAATRVEAGVMLIRLLGKEKEAQEAKYTHPFTDVPDWADNYIGYLYHEKLSGGVSTSEYGSTQIINSAQYMTFVLRALGYDDKNGDFKWDESINAAYDLGIIGETDHMKYKDSSTEFLRDDLVNISFKALDRNLKNQPRKRLINVLIEQGEVTELSAEEAGLATNEGLFSPLEFGVVEGVSPINPEAFNMDIDKTWWRNKYNFTNRNIRFKIDKSKLPDSMKDYTKLCFHRSWKDEMNRETLSSFLKTDTKYFFTTDPRIIDDEGWVMTDVGVTAYDVLLLADNSEKILGYFAIKYHFDEDIADYFDLNDRAKLINMGVLNGMKPLKNVQLKRYDRQVKVLFDKSEMPEAVYESARAFSNEPHGSTYPDSNRIEESIIEYSNVMGKILSDDKEGDPPGINAWVPKLIDGKISTSNTYEILTSGWGKNLCLYIVYNKNYKPIGYAVFEKTKALIH